MNLVKIEKYHSDKYDVDIERYLTNAQIQNIAEEISKHDKWAEREAVKEYMVMCYALGFTKKEANKVNADLFKQSGLWDEMKSVVENIYEIDEAVKYEESVMKYLNTLTENLPSVAKSAVEGVIKDGNKRDSK